jgi:glutamate synthase (NADPH/NADH) small chain
VAQMQAEGVTFRTGVMVGAAKDPLGKGSKVTNWAKETVTPEQLQKDFDAMLLTGGAEQSRDLPVPGRDLDGIHFAMEFLPQQNKMNAGDKLKGQLRADGKHVIVIGGGDTGSDCVGTSNRHGAVSVTQFELLPQPPEVENRPMTWPYWPIKLRTSSSHEEGCEREFAISTKEFIGEKGKVTGLKTVRIEMKDGKLAEVPGSEQILKADLVLLAMGFVSRWPPCWTPSVWKRTPAATPRPRPTSSAATPPARPRCLPPATCAAARAWWSGPSAKAVRARVRWTNS